jgi:hypothetical protein
MFWHMVTILRGSQVPDKLPKKGSVFVGVCVGYDLSCFILCWFDTYYKMNILYHIEKLQRNTQNIYSC